MGASLAEDREGRASYPSVTPVLPVPPPECGSAPECRTPRRGSHHTRMACPIGSSAMPATTESPITVYTDGACSGNPGPGCWAWAVAPDGMPSAAGGERQTTNQLMEIQAVVE